MANGNKHLGEESKRKYTPRGSQAPMFGAKGPETSGKRRKIKIGEAESDSVTQAPKATPRQKRGALEIAGSVVGGPVVGKVVSKVAAPLIKKAFSKTASKAAPSSSTAVVPASGSSSRAVVPASGSSSRAVTTTTPSTAVTTPSRAVRPRNVPRKPPTDKGKIVGLSPKGKIVGAGIAAGTGYGAKKLYDIYDKEAGATPTAKPPKKAEGSKATINKEPTVNKISDYELADDTNIMSPSKPASKPKASKPKASKPQATPKPKAKAKAKKNPDYEYYGKEGTGLGDFSRKHGIQYATEEGYKKWFDTHDGEKKGGRPGKGKMKTQGMNRSKRSGFSGRGSGAALRGF